MNELYIYTTPIGATVVVKPDMDPPSTAEQSSDTGRADEQKIEFPASLARQGAQLTVSAPRHDEFSGRGLLQPQQVCPNCGYVVASECFFGYNDVHLKETAVAPLPPDPPTPTFSEPLDVINHVYASGSWNLKTKEGCGQFTEACCDALAHEWGTMWGHVYKTAGQNQYHAHAVDAVMALYGEYAGIWDIITSSVSSSAKPAFNDAGDVKPELWRPPQPLPCVAAGRTATGSSKRK